MAIIIYSEDHISSLDHIFMKGISVKEDLYPKSNFSEISASGVLRVTVMTFWKEILFSSNSYFLCD